MLPHAPMFSSDLPATRSLTFIFQDRIAVALKGDIVYPVAQAFLEQMFGEQEFWQVSHWCGTVSYVYEHHRCSRGL